MVEKFYLVYDDTDELELPFGVFFSLKEVASCFGCSLSSVYACLNGCYLLRGRYAIAVICG